MPRFATLDTNENTLTDDTGNKPAVLKVVGVGGGGCNAIESMMKRGLNGVEYVAVNTDAQVLRHSNATHKCQVGNGITRGLGAGADPKVGREAIEEDRKNIEKILKGSDMVFVTAGMGGGTGTGGAPVVASIAKSLDALVVGIVTKPFKWEGKKRMMNAEQGINELRQYVDSLIVIPNERLLNILDKSVSASMAFDKPNEVLFDSTRGIADIITITGIINVDFADVRAVMSQSGDALMGCGSATGENRAIEAARKAISSPLLEGIDIQGAKNILLNVTGSDSLTMQEINEGNQVIYDAAGEEANVIFGWVNKEDMGEEVSYTVIATGFSKAKQQEKEEVKEEVVMQTQRKAATGGGGYSEPAGMGGFNPRDYNSGGDNVDFEIPAIYRVKGSNNNIMGSGNFEAGGFQNDNYQSVDPEIQEEPREAKPRQHRGDKSSFLRNMMD
ncbi:MAG: hypothetical protein SCALA702_12850 [Melioribacteraceae bacterium]|nr:MAG: hypothetical protein SCALA702_12850 [Melioribacteraceae bacterium]